MAVSASLTVTIDDATLARVDAAAAERDTTREEIAGMALALFLRDAERNRDFPPLTDWQLAEVEAGLREAERGEFASDEEVRAIFDRYRS